MKSYSVCMEYVVYICYDPWSELMSFSVWITSCVVCHISNNKSLSDGYIKCFCEVIWSGVASVWVWVILTMTAVIVGMWLGSGPVIPVPVLWWCLEVDLVWCLVLEWCLFGCAGVPDGGILSGQSACYMTILITIKTSYTGAMMGNVP